MAVLAAPAPPAESAVCPPPGACVIVHLMGDRQGETIVSVTDITAWANAEGQPPDDYRVREVAGGATQLEGISQALALRAFIGHLAERGGAFAGLTPADIRLVKIPRPRIGYVSTLEGANLLPGGSNGFIDNQEPVLHTPGGTDTIAYARPLTSSTDDVNRLDIFQSDGNAPLDLTLSTTGSVLHPTITASPANPAAGDSVTFTAAVPDAPPGTTYAWTFGGGGGTSTAESPTHTWASAGNWGVGLVVEAPDNSYGHAATVVTVGDPPPPTTSPTVPPTPGGGGGDGTGTGQSPGPSTGTPTSSASPSSSPSSSPTPSSGPDPTSDPTPEDDPTEDADPSTEEAPGSDPSPSPTPTPSPTPNADAGDRTVSGLLLDSAGGLNQEPSGTPSAAQSTSTVTPVIDHLDVTARVVWAIILLTLLTLGAVSELRPHPRRPRHDAQEIA